MNNSSPPILMCTGCNSTYPISNEYYICPKCHGTLKINYDLDSISIERFHNNLANQPKNMWRFANLLPIINRNNIQSLGEGGTPLLKSLRLANEIGITNLFFKNEGLNPTGSFKDRQVSVGVSKAVEFNKKVIGVTSTGNVGYATAAYSAKCGFDCHIIIWDQMKGLSDPTIKMKPALLFGADVKKTPSIESSAYAKESYLLMRDICIEKGWVPMISARCVNPFAEEGAKTIAFEICEDLHWKSPDWIFCPIGGGGLISEIWQGFNELKGLGLIEKLPKLAGFQSGGFQHVAYAFIHQMADVESVYPILQKSATGYSLDGEWALSSIRESAGYADILHIEQVTESQKLLAKKEGIIAETMGVWGLTGLISGVTEGKIDSDEDIVVCITGKNIDYSPLFSPPPSFQTIQLKEWKNQI